MSSKIILYKGRRGCGKTLTMVKDGFKYFKGGRKVLRNFECKFGEYISEEQILDLNKESLIFRCVIMLDEIQIFFDARRSMRKQNLTFSNFIQQIRKRDIILLASTQFINTVDLRFRQHADLIAYPKFFPQFLVCEVIYQDVTALEDYIETSKEPPSVKLVYDAKPVFKLYNTEEMIK